MNIHYCANIYVTPCVTLYYFLHFICTIFTHEGNRRRDGAAQKQSDATAAQPVRSI